MEGVFLKILNMSISAGWLVLAVVVLRLALQKAPKALRVVLWGIVGLRLIWPFSIESILSLIPSKETVPPDIGMAATPAIQSGVPVVNSLVNPVLGSSMAATPQYSINPMQVFQFIAAWVWVIGMGIMVLYALGSWMVVRLRVREAVREDNRVWLCDRVGSPFILGIFRPRIYLPSDIGLEDKPYVLAHEQAHLQRRDHWWKPLGFALLAVHWFNPLVWLAYILLCRDIELACDERVIRSLGETGKKPYSEALIHCSVPRHMIAACPVAFGETGVKGRIKSVLHYKKPAFWIILVAVLVCIAVAVCFLTDPRQPETETKTVATKVPEAETETVAKEVPELMISDGNSAIKAWQGGYNWSYAQDGKTVNVIADADHPTAVVDKLPRLELLPSAYSHTQGNTVSLTFGQAPDRFSIIALPADVTSSSGSHISTSTNSFDLLRGEFIYVIQATWNAHGAAQYAFLGNYRVPIIEDPNTTLAELQRKYPQYFGLDTSKGLEVYIWQMAPNSHSCVLLPGRDQAYTTEEIMALHQSSLGIQEMLLILESYGVYRSDISVNPIRMVYSSYAYTIDEEYTQALRNYFWEMAPFWAWTEDWGLTFTAESRDGKTLTVNCIHEGGQQTGILYYSDYTLYSEAEQSHLQKLNPPSAADMGRPTTTLPQGQTRLVLEIEKDFDTLPKGDYQLVLDVTDIYDPETVDPNALNLRDNQTYYIPFTID